MKSLRHNRPQPLRDRLSASRLHIRSLKTARRVGDRLRAQGSRDLRSEPAFQRAVGRAALALRRTWPPRVRQSWEPRR